MANLTPLSRLDPARFEAPAILKRLATASRQLAELKGVAASIPDQGILINTLGLQEAKDSSAIENIVTTHDELFREVTFPEGAGSPAAKEVARYRQALHVGFQGIRQSGLLTNNLIVEIQAELEQNQAGIRKVPGTVLKDSAGRIVYTPPSPELLPDLLTDLEAFVNDDALFAADPLIKMAIAHYQFESIHPFYDGNGRTGRILNVLYLVKEGLLRIPVLYMSRYIVETKPDYYRLLQAVRDDGAWEEWTLYMLTAAEDAARDGVVQVERIKALMLEVKHRIRERYRFYSQDLINNLFNHPYTKIGFVERDLDVSRLTATRYLDELSEGGFLVKRKVGRSNYYINLPLCRILAGDELEGGEG